MKINRILSLLLILIITSCAKQARPPGGPVDKTPPFVVETTPKPGAVNVDTLTGVEVIFSEGINPSSAKDAIFITPFQGENVNLRFRGRKISVKFIKPLAINRTYVITFGTGISDYRSNKMDSSFTLAFSTGPVLDKGEITGSIIDNKDVKGVDVWAYQYISKDPDPSKISPDYIVQCSSDGSFKFNHISPGKYRLFAVKDHAADKIYQPVEDEIGVCFKDAFLMRDSISVSKDFFIKMTREDTAGPCLQRASAITNSRVALQFNEPVLLDSCTVSISEAESQMDSLKIVSLWQNQPQIIFAETNPQKKIDYNVRIINMFDYAGNNIDTAFSSYVFHGNVLPDTTNPSVIRTTPESGAALVDVSTDVSIIFSEPVDTTFYLGGVSISDTSNNAVTFNAKWDSLWLLLLKPENSLESNKIYQIKLSGDSVKDLYGNFLSDTSFSFKTVNTDTLGKISGTVVDPEKAAKGKIIIHAEKLDKPEREYEFTLDKPGEFRFSNTLPGKYILSAFRDRDNSNSYSFGRPFPYIPSERFVVKTDTVVVKSRWRNQNNVITLPAYKTLK